MPRIPNPYNFAQQSAPSYDTGYTHPATTRQGVIPMAFQVTSPLDNQLALMPHALVLHVNPSNFAESPTKKVERIQTRGGFVEQHWGDELTEISADSSTGAFMNLTTGLSSVVRQRTIAWDRYRDLLDLFYNNGSVYDPFGNIVLQGSIMLMYDKGTYIGTFRTFSVDETGDSPFVFNLSWTFKVEQTIVQLPMFTNAGTGNSTGTYVLPVSAPAPGFQSQNIPTVASAVNPPSTSSSNVVPAPSPATPTSTNSSATSLQEAIYGAVSSGSAAAAVQEAQATASESGSNFLSSGEVTSFVNSK